MRSRANRALAVAALALALGSCIQQERVAHGPRPQRAAQRWPVPDMPVKVGAPYQVAGVTYVPRDARDYDETGLASWYGHESGDRTANGETFRPGAISAAHKTLPLPSYVEVTALESGRTILVRINDRGPFVAGRIIDLSEGAAQALDIHRGAPARVRVRRVDPPEADKLALRTGRPAAPRASSLPMLMAHAVPRPRSELKLDLPPAEPDAIPMAAPVQIAVAEPDGWFVQVAAFSDRARADALVPALGLLGHAGVAQAGPVFRVRMGPFDETAARAALAQVQGRGYQGAVLVKPHAQD